MVIQWLRLCDMTVGEGGAWVRYLVGKLKILHASWHGQKKKKIVTEKIKAEDKNVKK